MTPAGPAGRRPSDPARPGGYTLRNADPAEAARLGTLESLHDRSTARQLEALGIGPGWHCAELGAGAGSVARWMLERVGPGGRVTAIDRDTSLLADLAGVGNAEVVTGDLTTMDLGDARYDLVHSRAVLMHLEDPDAVVGRIVGSLRPGGRVLFEEVDGDPARVAAARGGLPGPFLEVMVPLAARWCWAGTLAGRLRALGLEDVRDDVRTDELRGATPGAAFWAQTLETVRPVLTATAGDGGAGDPGIDDAAIDAMVRLLADAGFAVPFAARHRVSGRAPGTAAP